MSHGKMYGQKNLKLILMGFLFGSVLSPFLFAIFDWGSKS